MLNILKKIFKPKDLEPKFYTRSFLLEPYIQTIYHNYDIDANKVKDIFTYIDSSTNNNSGDCVIFSLTKVEDKFVLLSTNILFGSEYGQDFNKNGKIIREHFLNLKREFIHTKFIVICEAPGYSYSNFIYINDIKRLFDENNTKEDLYFFPNFQDTDSYGVFTTEALRRKMLMNIEDKLKNNLIHTNSMFTFDMYIRLKYQLLNVYFSNNMVTKFGIMGNNDLASSLMITCYYCDTYKSWSQI